MNPRPTPPALMSFLATLLLLILCLVPSAVQAQTGKGGGREGTPTAQSAAARQGAEDENEAYRHSAVVQKLGGMMGVSTDRAATVFEVFNFLVLAVLVGTFLAKSLPKTFRARTSTIQKQLVDARQATEEANVRMNSIEDRLAQLDGNIAAMRAQSEKDLAAEEQRMRASLEEERQKILAAADQEIAAATMHSHRQLQQYAAELAIEQAARKLAISAETDRLLVQQFAARLGEDGQKGGAN